MRKLILSILSITFFSFASYSGETILEGRDAENFHPKAKLVRLIDNSSIPDYFEFRDEDKILKEEFLTFVSNSFDIAEGLSFSLIAEEIDDLGYTHLFYSQNYNGIPIKISNLNVLLKDGLVYSFSGVFTNQLPEQTEASVEESTALSTCLKNMGAKTYKWEIEGEEKFIKREQNNLNATFFPKGKLTYINKDLEINEKLKLCFRFNIYSHEPLSRMEYYVDANTNEVIFINSLLHTGGGVTPARGASAYSDTVNIITDSVSNYFRLRDSTRGASIETYDLGNRVGSGNAFYASATDFIDSNNLWNTFNPPLDRYAIDAHWGTEVTYDYFKNIHNWNSINDSGFALKSYVHYGTNYVNAFWDGQRMTYGDGDATTTPLTTLDICGHEVAHGWTSRRSGLVYANESGAINESFSDIWGVVIENYGRPNNWNWLMGEDIGSAFRSLSNPNQYGDPDTYGGAFWIDQNCVPTRNNDYCGVHTNSGVQNYWFYLLSEGGSGVNDNADSFLVNGVGIIKAAKIAFRNNTYELFNRVNANHADARFYSIRAAAQLYGGCSPEVEAVTNAWYAVGVGSPYQNGVSAEFVSVIDTVYCQLPAIVEFNSDGSNALAFRWDFGDSQTDTVADPIHTYSTPGNYDVTLITDGAQCGTDTVLKSSYIKVDTSRDCSILLSANAITTVDCNGSFIDNGGINGNYSLNEDDTLIISPNNSDFIVLKFQSFDVESGDYSLCNRDFVEVYDGGFEDKLIGRYCSNNLPPDSIVSSSNKLTVLFHSDDKIANEGFKANWECNIASIRPIADFSLSKDSSCNGIIKFFNESSIGTNSWGWNFGDGNVSFEKNPTHKYLSSGSYDVTLRVTNTLGNSFIRKTNAVVVSLPTSPLVVNDTVCSGGDAKLSATGTPQLDWYSNPESTTKLFTGDTFRLNNLTFDLDFFVESFQKGARVIGTPFAISGNGYYSSKSEEMYFDVHEPSIIESVILNSNRFGIRRVDLRNNLGEIIASKDVLATANPTQVTLDFEVYPDTAYSLSIGSREPDLYVNSTGATYPYPIGSMMTLTGSSLGSSAYPFFYYWIARPLDCVSERVNVRAIVDTSCVLVDLNELDALNSIRLSPNPFNDVLYIDNIPKNTNYNLSIFNLNGAEVKRLNNLHSEGARTELNMADLPAGFYLLRLKTSETIKTFKIVKSN